MIRGHIHKRVSILILLTTLSVGCSDSQTVIESGQTTGISESPETGNSAPEQDHKESGPGKEKASPVVTTPKRKPLDLSIDTVPLERQKTSKAHSKLHEDRLLPDLFKSKTDKEPVSVKGKLLMNEGAEDLSNSVDGAGVSIQFDTE